MADEGVKCSDCGLLGPLMSYGWHSDCKPFVEVLASRALAAEALLRECVPRLEHPKSACGKWTHHQIEGWMYNPNKQCTCGLDDLLARVRKAVR